MAAAVARCGEHDLLVGVPLVESRRLEGDHEHAVDRGHDGRHVRCAHLHLAPRAGGGGRRPAMASPPSGVGARRVVWGVQLGGRGR
eukprot:6725076-Pyramimonas_sp.AAC.1